MEAAAVAENGRTERTKEERKKRRIEKCVLRIFYCLTEERYRLKSEIGGGEMNDKDWTALQGLNPRHFPC